MGQESSRSVSQRKPERKSRARNCLLSAAVVLAVTPPIHAVTWPRHWSTRVARAIVPFGSQVAGLLAGLLMRTGESSAAEGSFRVFALMPTWSRLGWPSSISSAGHRRNGSVDRARGRPTRPPARVSDMSRVRTRVSLERAVAPPGGTDESADRPLARIGPHKSRSVYPSVPRGPDAPHPQIRLLVGAPDGALSPTNIATTMLRTTSRMCDS